MDFSALTPILTSQTALLAAIGVGTMIAVVGIGAATVVAWDDRADPRDTDEPEVSATLLDPIEATLALRDLEPAVVLHVVERGFPALVGRPEHGVGARLRKRRATTTS